MGLKISAFFNIFKLCLFLRSIITDLAQLQIISNLVFETMGKGVHFHPLSIFPIKVSNDLLNLENISFKKNCLGCNYLKLQDLYFTNILKTVSARELKVPKFCIIWHGMTPKVFSVQHLFKQFLVLILKISIQSL